MRESRSLKRRTFFPSNFLDLDTTIVKAIKPNYRRIPLLIWNFCQQFTAAARFLDQYVDGVALTVGIFGVKLPGLTPDIIHQVAIFGGLNLTGMIV